MLLEEHELTTLVQWSRMENHTSVNLFVDVSSSLGARKGNLMPNA